MIIPRIFNKGNRTSSFHFIMIWLLCCAWMLAGCKVSYSLRDATIDPKIKTVKISFVQNRAKYINPQAAQKFYDKLQQKIINGTKLTRSNADNADYVISATITTYDGTQTVGVSSQKASTNRLTISLEVLWKKTLDNDEEKFDVSRSFDYSATLSFQQAEAQLLDEAVRTLTDDIFNRIFSNW